MSTIRGIARLVVASIFIGVSAFAADEKEKIDPATLKDKVTITLGKKLIVQFEQKGNALSNPKVVEQVGEKTPTPTFEFTNWQETLVLTTQNRFPKDLKFRALVRLKNRKDYFETSIVPVMSGLSGFELWQDPIEELVLFEFTLIDKK